MALSLSGERSVAAVSRAHPLHTVLAWIASANRARARRNTLKRLLELDHARLRDLGVTHMDVAHALSDTSGRSAGMMLSAARARNSQA
jgi:uncharacterized protein YjiS (DUF1127 family)